MILKFEGFIFQSFITALSTDEICWPTRDENTQSVEEIMKIYLQDLKENPVKYVNEVSKVKVK